MAAGFFCDRCKEPFKLEERKNIYWTADQENAFQSGVHYDLCENCEKSLEKWWRNLNRNKDKYK